MQAADRQPVAVGPRPPPEGAPSGPNRTPTLTVNLTLTSDRGFHLQARGQRPDEALDLDLAAGILSMPAPAGQPQRRDPADAALQQATPDGAMQQLLPQSSFAYGQYAIEPTAQGRRLSRQAASAGDSFVVAPVQLMRSLGRVVTHSLFVSYLLLQRHIAGGQPGESFGFMPRSPHNHHPLLLGFSCTVLSPCAGMQAPPATPSRSPDAGGHFSLRCGQLLVSAEVHMLVFTLPPSLAVLLDLAQRWFRHHASLFLFAAGRRQL